VALLENPAGTPSARVLDAMARDHDDSYIRFVLAQSAAHRQALLALPLDPTVAVRYAQQAAASLSRQRDIEAADTLPFDAFLQRYLSPDSLEV
jgi:glutamate--cysteine ligase